MFNSRLLKILVFIETCFNSLECSISSLYEIKYSSNSLGYDANTAYKTAHLNLKIENTPCMKCLLKCNLITNCSSVVMTKYNSSYSLCLGFDNFININTDTSVTYNQIISQKILYKFNTGLSSGNFFFFLFFIQ